MSFIPERAANRIAGHGHLNPNKPITFSFDGKIYPALEGDTVASALLAHGVHLVGRSFKYHRPRGILSAGSDEPNALVGIARDGARRQPNVRASVQEIFDGMQTTSQNHWPSLAFDIGAANDRLSRFFPAGFYYKTFMWPASAWQKFYEPQIRATAGLGLAPTETDPDRYANQYVHCDVLIVGAGPAGIAAALEASKGAKQVILCEENPHFGGNLGSESTATIDRNSAAEWVSDNIARLTARDNVLILNRTTAFGYYQQNYVVLSERVSDHLAEPDADLPRERLWQVRAGSVVLASGAIERHIVFADNDRPGIMMASAARAFLNRYGVTPGHKVGVYTYCDSAYAAAFDLKRAGIDIPMLVDGRDNIDAGLLATASGLGIEVATSHAVVATSGRLRVRSMTIETNDGAARRNVEIDCLIMSGGWTPSVHLFSQSRGKLVFDGEHGRFLPGTAAQNCISAGGCNGTHELAEAINEGISAGAKAATGRTKKPKTVLVENAISTTGHKIGAAPGAGPDKPVKAFIDFQNDVLAKDVRLAVKEGFHSIEHVKRYTTTGMATDQGKMSNMHGLAIAAEALDKPIPQVGLTTFRAPFTPVTFGAIVNHARDQLFDPIRLTAMHQCSVELDAVFENVGQWKRAWYYPKAGEDMDAAVNRECVATREAAGIFDASTLGKIEVVGPDAVKFMNLMYTNPWDKLGVGRCRYGIMCREDGFIYDDGVVARMAEDRFHVTTTTGGAPNVLNHMEDYLQTEFPDWQVYLTSVSEQWAVIGVQGPLARDIIAPLVEDIDLSAEAFPHMSVREGRICGVPTRLFRMSFTGELGFEINVPADFGAAVWHEIWRQGVPNGLTPYGTEAMHVMRAEKGFIIVGQDTDGTVTPHDAGLSWAIGKNKTDFVGMRGLARPDLQLQNRKQLVGLRTRDPNVVLEEGAQIVAKPDQPVPMKMLGHVTSSYWSEHLGHSIALALVAGGQGKIGETLYVPMPDHTIAVEVTSTVFHDREGRLVHG